MKRLVHLTLILAILLILGATIWIGIRKQQGNGEAADAAHPAEAPADSKAEAFAVKLEKERWQALELKMAPPEKAELKPQRIAFGRVLDPSPLVTLDGDLAAADAALAASRAEYERTQKLLAAGENTSRKVAETAEAQFRADEIKSRGLHRTALLDWGADFAALDGVQRREFADRFVQGDAALIRADVLPAEALAEPPRRARVLVLGREQTPVETQEITPAADADPKTQSQGFILRITRPPFPLRPGMALTAWLELEETPRAGFSVPRSAVLRHDGQTWVYVQEEGETFARKHVILDTPLDEDKGWFIAEGGGLEAGQSVVVTGAQSLLSEELKAQGSSPD